VCEAVGSDTIRARPNLVLIDEIDGAASTASDAGLIKLLLRLCSAGQKQGRSSADGEDGVEEEEEQLSPGKKPSKTSSKKGSSAVLCRPIVCVCNNLYAPSLKALRQVALVVQVRRPVPIILAKRLRTICEAEGLKADSKCLVDLCDAMDCDLRSCLHALQVLRSNEYLTN